MSHHIHHHHARSPVMEKFYEKQAKDAQFDVETVVSVVVVTQGAGDSPSTAMDSTPSFSRENGAPVANTRVSPAAVSSAAASSATYVAPSRQQRPNAASHTTAPASASSVSHASFAGFPSSQTVAPQTTLVSSKIPPSILVASSAALSSSFGVAAPASTSDSANLQKTTQSSGMSGGAKAGLAFGIIIVIALMVGLVVFFVRRKKQANEEHQRLDDEKSELHKKSQSISSHVSVRRSKTNAPRLSLRPVTQMFLPMSEKQDGSSLIANSLSRSRTPEPVAQAPAETSNPFGDHAEEKAVIAAPPAAAAPAISSNSSDRTLSNLSDVSAVSEGQGSPSAVAGSRRNSPPGPGPNNVHRVQLDFKPSMEDELELRAGSLVRMLHEYDDGWALCIRLDRSQQGVVPRTCVSKLPVKPRPGPPPAARGPPPQGRARGPSNAPGPRMPMNGPPRGPPPAGRMRSQSNAPRQPRPQSPALAHAPQQVRPRANSDAVPAPRSSPPSPLTGALAAPAQAALPARKPVPGQAI